jgi:ribose transport system substrate-binding protein
MKFASGMLRSVSIGALAAAAVAIGSAAYAAGPAVGDGPGGDPACFKPLKADTKYFQWPAKPGPYRIALANGFIANDWRVQMIKVAKAYAEQQSADVKEFKVVSVGQDVAAQIAAVNNFIDQGYDAIIVNANSTSAFGSVVKKANDAGVVLLSFDNVIDDPNNIQINVDQVGIGRLAGEHLLKNTKANPAKFLFVRGPAGQPVDAARAEGFNAAIAADGRKVEVTEVEGKWNPGDAQKVTADAIAAGGVFDGIYVEGGSQGAAQAMVDAGKFIVPMAGEDENAFRQLCNANHDKGMICESGGTGPAQSAVTVKTAIAALKGEKIPQQIALPTSISYSPYKEGSEVFKDLPGSLFTGNNFPDCKIGFTVEEINSQSGDNN